MDEQRRLLEPDTSLLENKLCFVNNELEAKFDDIFRDAQQNGESSAAGGGSTLPYKIIKPDPGFCVKAHTLIDNEKYFVNICQSDGIPSPEDISVEQLTEILSSETPNTYKIPMSITELRKTNDKSGKEATACDVAINPQFYKKINASIVFRDFFIAIIFEAFDSKYNIQINRDTWIILKNRKCIGTLVKHLVQNRDVKQVYQSYQNPPKSLIEDLDNSFEPKRKAKSRSLIQEIKKDATTVAAATNNARIVNIKQHCPEYRLYFRSAPFSHIVGEFFMPEIPSQSEINLNIAKNQILLQSRNGSYSLNKFLEYDVEPTKCDAQFNKQTHMLRINMPICGN